MMRGKKGHSSLKQSAMSVNISVQYDLRATPSITCWPVERYTNISLLSSKDITKAKITATSIW